MKNKKMKIFSTGWKIMNWHFLAYLNLAVFKYAFRFFISFFDQKLQPSGVGPFWPNLMVLAVLALLQGAITFDLKKIRMNDTECRFEISDVQIC